ncbi:hypothetical protein DBR42_22550 [Pelomonas sp. HMWF004]|nr:hypothetical protein DBR42_22550 [Pelomonas sp. HMWF004]
MWVGAAPPRQRRGLPPRPRSCRPRACCRRGRALSLRACWPWACGQRPAAFPFPARLGHRLPRRARPVLGLAGGSAGAPGQGQQATQRTQAHEPHDGARSRWTVVMGWALILGK